MALEKDAAVVFDAVIKKNDSYYPQNDCSRVLRQSWDSFEGSWNDYREMEVRYFKGANSATICAISRGFYLHLLLEELRKQVAAGVVRKSGFDVAVKAAEAANVERQYTDFMKNVNCRASTPPISGSGNFRQVIHQRCETKYGPADVNLRTLHITIAGKDVWNGPKFEYFGSSITKALAK